MKPGQPSRTALLVAGGICFAANEPELRGLVDAEAVRLTRLLLGACGPGRNLLRWIDSTQRRTLLKLLERCTIPGIVRHWICRKRWIEASWRAAQRDGFDTLVVLGCGFDTLSLRAGETAHVIDVDRTPVLTVRRAALARLGLRDHALIEHDLEAPGLDRQLARALAPTSSTFVLIEGVLMYLEPSRVDDLFAELRELSGQRLRIGFTFMESPRGAAPAFRPRSRLVDAWLRWRREPFRSGLDPSELRGWLRQHGFELTHYSPTPARADAGLLSLRGEAVALADRAH